MHRIVEQKTKHARPCQVRSAAASSPAQPQRAVEDRSSPSRPLTTLQTGNPNSPNDEAGDESSVQVSIAANLAPTLADAVADPT